MSSRSRFDRADHAVIERNGIEPGEPPGLDGAALVGCSCSEERMGPLLRLHEDGIVGVAQIDGERGRCRNHIDEVGVQFHSPDRRNLGGAEVVGEFPHERRSADGDHTGVFAQVHRRRARMIGAAQ